MSNPNPTRVSAGTPEGGRFAPNGQAEAGISFGAESRAPSDAEVTERALNAEIEIYQVAKARIELLSVKFAAQVILEEFPEATHLRMGPSDQTYGELVPEEILDADGGVLADEYDDFEGFGHAVMNLNEDGVWITYSDDGDTVLNLKSAAAISAQDIETATTRKTVYAGLVAAGNTRDETKV